MPGSRWPNGRIALKRCVTVEAPRSNARPACSAVASEWPHATTTPRAWRRSISSSAPSSSGASVICDTGPAASSRSSRARSGSRRADAGCAPRRCGDRNGPFEVGADHVRPCRAIGDLAERRDELVLRRRDQRRLEGRDARRNERRTRTGVTGCVRRREVDAAEPFTCRSTRPGIATPVPPRSSPTAAIARRRSRRLPRRASRPQQPLGHRASRSQASHFPRSSDAVRVMPGTRKGEGCLRRSGDPEQDGSFAAGANSGGSGTTPDHGAARPSRAASPFRPDGGPGRRGGLGLHALGGGRVARPAAPAGTRRALRRQHLDLAPERRARDRRRQQPSRRGTCPRRRRRARPQLCRTACSRRTPSARAPLSSRTAPRSPGVVSLGEVVAGELAAAAVPAEQVEAACSHRQRAGARRSGRAAGRTPAGTCPRPRTRVCPRGSAAAGRRGDACDTSCPARRRAERCRRSSSRRPRRRPRSSAGRTPPPRAPARGCRSSSRSRGKRTSASSRARPSRSARAAPASSRPTRPAAPGTRRRGPSRRSPSPAHRRRSSSARRRPHPPSPAALRTPSQPSPARACPSASPRERGAAASARCLGRPSP